MMNLPKLKDTTFSRSRSQRGAALVICLILLLVLTVLAISGMSTSTLELQMVGNQQFQENAFQAAENGGEQAISNAVYSTNTTLGSYAQDATGEWVPVRGTGRVIAGCNSPADAPVDQRCEYFLRFDDTAGVTAVPGGGYSLGTGFQAYHFVVDSFGVDARGGQSQHQQSFYIVGPGAE
jgi:type IV pilus assembly protein PilX